MIELKLPSLGSDMDQGRLLEWRVKPGDVVKRGQVVAVVDTSKAAIDVEIWHDGTVHALLAQPDQMLPVGTPILALLEPGEAAPAPRDAVPPPVTAAAASTAAVAPEPAVVTKDTATMAPRPSAPPAVAERRRISPAARKHAEELGIDISTLAGSGPGGAVTLEDIERAHAPTPVKRSPAPETPSPAPAATGERVALMRRTIASAMARAKREIPHYYLATEVPLERATRWLAQENERRPVTQRLLLAALVIKAVALAAKRYPEMNGFYRDDAFQPSAQVHVGVAISLRQGGLIAPALLDTDARAIDEVMSGLTDLVKRARAFSLKASELSSPTLTLTNLGDQGVDLVQAVIYPPQVAIVGFGRPSQRAWVENDALKLIPVATASLAADHRVSDGHRGALFLAAIRDLLQAPEKL